MGIEEEIAALEAELGVGAGFGGSDASLYGSYEEESTKNEYFIEDAVNLGKAGWNQGWSDLFGGFGVDSIGDWFQEGADEELEGLSQETLDAMSNLGFAEDKEITARGLAATVIQSAGQMGTLIIPGTALGKAASLGARTVSGLAKAEKALKLAKASGKTKTVAKLEESITKSKNKFDKMGSALGYGTVSGSQFYEQGADEVEGLIRNATDSELLASDVYVNSLYRANLDTGLGGEEAFNKAKEDYIDSKRIEVGSKNALVGFFTGGALSPMYSGLIKGTAASTVGTGFAKGFATEGTQEIVQEGGSAALVKDALPVLGKNINIADRAAVGFLAGGIAGGTMGGVSGAFSSKEIDAADNVNEEVLNGNTDIPVDGTEESILPNEPTTVPTPPTDIGDIGVTIKDEKATTLDIDNTGLPTAEQIEEDLTPVVDPKKAKATNDIARKEAQAVRAEAKATRNAAADPTNVDKQEAVVTAQEKVEAVADEVAVKDVADKEEALAATKEEFLANPKPKSFKGVKLDDLKSIAESLGLDVQPAEGKKRVTAPQLREAINANEEVIAAREAKTTTRAEQPLITGGKKRKLRTNEVAAVEEATMVDEAMAKPIVDVTEEEKLAEVVENTRVEEAEAKLKADTKEATIAQAKADKAARIKKEIEAELDPFNDWIETDGTFEKFNDDTASMEIFTPSKADRAAYYKSKGEVDAEILDAKYIKDTAYTKALREFNVVKSQYENGTVSLEEMQKATKTFDQTLQKAANKEAKAAKGDTTTKATEAVTEPQGASEGVVGQEEVAGPTAEVDTTVDTVMDADEEVVMTAAEWELKQAEDKVVEAKAKVASKKKPAKKKKQKATTSVSLSEFKKLDDQAREDLEISGGVSEEIVQQYEQEQEIADLGEVDVVKDLATKVKELPKRLRDKIEKGYVNAFGVGEEVAWAIENQDKIALVDARTDELVTEGMKGGVAFQQAVAEVMETNGMNSIIPDVTAEEKQAILDGTEDLTNKFDNQYLESKEEAQKILKDRYGSDWGNLIEWRKGPHPTGMNISATYYPNNKGTGKVVVWLENVKKDDLAELMLHEKGIHQLLADTPGMKKAFKAVLARMEALLETGDAEVTEARDKATTAYDRKHGENAFFRADRTKVIAEETIAYLMNAGVGRGWFRNLTAKVKLAFKELFNVNLTVDELRMVVADMLTTDAASYEATMKGTGLNVDVNEDYQPTAEERALFGMDSEASVDPELVTDYHTRPDTNYMTQFDIIGKSVDWIKTWADKAKVQGLGLIPNRPLLEMLDRLLPDGINVSDVQNWYDKAEASADIRIEKLDESIIKPLQRYQRDDKAGYDKMVRMALQGSLNTKNMKGSTTYQSLSPTGQAMYDTLLGHYRTMAKDKIEALRAYTNSLDISTEKKAEMLTTVTELAGQIGNNKGYFPFNRFGNFKVEGILPDGERYVSHHDNLRQANKAKARKIKEGGTFAVSKVTNYQQASNELMTSEAYNKAEKFIQDAGGNKVAEEALWKAFLEYSPQNALKRKVAARRSVMGMSADMVRGIGLSIHGDIRLNERLKVKGEVDKIFTKVSKAIKDTKGDTIEHQELYDELRKREVVDVRASWSKTVTKANFGYYLGFNPASALINLTQNAIVAMPVLSADYGIRRTFTMMNKEFAHVVKNIANTDKQMGYTGLQGRAMQAMMEDGTVNVTQAHMMTGINEGHTADFDPEGFGSKFTKGMAFMFHNAEIANRATTAMTAFNLKYEETGDYDKSLSYAKTKTFESQFDFSETGKSRLQRSDVGNVLLAMKSYPISMAVYMTQNFNRWLLDSKATPTEKRAAKVKFLGTMIATTAIGGAAAVPLTGIIPEIFGMLFGEEEDDPEAIVREAIFSIAGETLGAVMLDGLVGTVTGLDLTSKVSLGLDMFARVQGGQSAKQFKEAIVEGAFGPVGGMVSNVVRGWDMIDEGKMAQGITTILPAALRNVVKGVDMGIEGRSLTSKDTLIQDTGAKDALLKALGFNSDEHAEYFRKSGTEFRRKASIKQQKQVLSRRYAWAIIQGDTTTVQEIKSELREFNIGKPPNEHINRSTLRGAVRSLREKLKGDK